MAITVSSQVLVDGSRNAVVKLHLVSGAAVDVTDQSLIDISALLANSPAKVKIMAIESSSSDMDIDLHWDATSNVDIMTLPVGEDVYDFRRIGGLINNAGAGVTGDILFSTRGAASDSEATILLELKKKY